MQKTGSQSAKLDYKIFQEQTAMLFNDGFQIDESYFEAPPCNKASIRRLHRLDMKKFKSFRGERDMVNLDTQQTEEIDEDKVDEEIDDFVAQHQSSTRCKVSLDDFQILKVLGVGGYGKVYLVLKKSDRMQYAMKVIKKSRVKSQVQQQRTRTEKLIYQQIDHPFIMKLHYAFQTPTKLYMVINYCPGGELFFHMQRKQPFSEEVTRFYAACILLGLQELHSNNIIYRDLKPENIMIDKDGYPIITDFGLSKANVSRTNSFAGTIEFMAPEMIQKKPYTNSVDWWSFGVLLYEMLCGNPPFYSANKEKTKFLITTIQPSIRHYLSDEAKDILQRLICKDPNERIGSSPLDGLDIMQHPFFQDIDWAGLLNKRIKAPMIPSSKGILNLEYFFKDFTDMSLESASNPEEDSQPKAPNVWENFSYQESVILNNH